MSMMDVGLACDGDGDHVFSYNSQFDSLFLGSTSDVHKNTVKALANHTYSMTEVKKG